MQRLFQPQDSQTAFDWADRWPVSEGLVTVPLAQAAGCVLASDLSAGEDIPVAPFCARDGYALMASDTLGAGDYTPLTLRLVAAGKPGGQGCASALAAGDGVPAWADAVLPLDQAEDRGALLDIVGSLAAGDGLVRVAEECAAGDLLVPAGRRLRPQDLARLALAGVKHLTVRRRPRVLVCLAGRFERDADGPMLTSLVKRDGGELMGVRHAVEPDSLIDAMTAVDVDLVLVAGGSGYGPDDLGFRALRECGRVDVDGVAIHPGGGLVLGEAKGRPVLLLPGTPLACLCAYDLLGARLLRRLAGRRGVLPYRHRELTLSRKIASSIGRVELARVRVNAGHAEPVAMADARILASSVRADGFILVPQNSEGYPQGNPVDVYLYDETD